MEFGVITGIVSVLSIAVAIFIQYLITNAFANCAKEKVTRRAATFGFAFFWA